jgi:DNA repair protein RadC
MHSLDTIRAFSREHTQTPIQPDVVVDPTSTSSDDTIIRQALAILESRYTTPDWHVEQADDARDYLRLKLAEEPERECFVALFLDTRHRVIANEILFKGTLDSAAVHPRVVVQKSLAYNAAAVIFAHNHPSGVAEPSRADQQLTNKLVEALALVDIRVLDHFVTGEGGAISFAETGRI